MSPLHVNTRWVLQSVVKEFSDHGMLGVPFMTSIVDSKSVNLLRHFNIEIDILKLNLSKQY